MNTDFRQQIKDLQQRKHIGTHTLAKQAGITPATLYNYLSKRTQMTAGNLTKVLDILNSLPDPDVSKVS